MKSYNEKTERITLEFSKPELIRLLVQEYQKQSGVLLKDIERKNCRLYANGKETHNLQLSYILVKTEGEDYNGE